MKRSSRFKSLRDYVDAQPRGKTQGDIARDLGIAESTLSQYLNGQAARRSIAERIAEQTGVPLIALLDPPEAATS